VIAVWLAAVTLAPGAPAAPLTSGTFKTPSGNIVCAYVYGGRIGHPTVHCGIKSGLKPPPPKIDCEGNGDPVTDRVTLRSTGRVGVTRCAGDAGPYAEQDHAWVLRYGRTWRHGRLRCSSRFKGLTCRNRQRHGFFLSRERWRRL
jgi:hypothetical protein